MKRIPLWYKKAVVAYAIVDDDDFEMLAKMRWHITSKGYARNGRDEGMHRLILKPRRNQWTDHVNGNRLDNRKKNLRVCSPTQNSMNRLRRSDNNSGFKGVSWNKKNRVWTAYITAKGRRTHLGCFGRKSDAAMAYDKAAKKIHGKFAKLNKYAE